MLTNKLKTSTRETCILVLGTCTPYLGKASTACTSTGNILQVNRMKECSNVFVVRITLYLFCTIGVLILVIIICRKTVEHVQVAIAATTVPGRRREKKEEKSTSTSPSKTEFMDYKLLVPVHVLILIPARR